MTDTHIEARREAVKTAACALGGPGAYISTYKHEEATKRATGLAGAVGANRPGAISESSRNDYAAAVVRVADFIMTGRLDANDALPDLREGVHSADKSWAEFGAGDVDAMLARLRRARGMEEYA